MRMVEVPGGGSVVGDGAGDGAKAVADGPVVGTACSGSAPPSALSVPPFR